MVILRTIFTTFVLVLAFYGAYLVYFQTEQVNENDITCAEFNTVCANTDNETAYSINFSPERVVVEREFVIHLRVNEKQQFSIKSAKIQGVSMYMGYIPLLFKPTGKNQWTAIAMLGSCSEPNMRWQILIELEHVDGKITTISEQFTSSRS